MADKNKKPEPGRQKNNYHEIVVRGLNRKIEENKRNEGSPVRNDIVVTMEFAAMFLTTD